MHKPKVAIIGAGIFGVSCAIELADDFEVVVFEQENDVMGKGTFANQYRHHYGFHYPRSKETVKQCLDAQDSFRLRWQEAIIEDIPSYYAVAKEGSRVTGSEFIKFCDEMGLQYKEQYPDSSFLNREAVELCILTNEPVYDIYKLKSLSKEILNKNKSTTLKLSSRVVGGKYDESTGKKVLSILSGGNSYEEEFGWRVIVFLREKHRSSHYFVKGDEVSIESGERSLGMYPGSVIRPLYPEGSSPKLVSRTL